MDVWFAATQFQKHKGVPPYEDFVHPAVSARSLPYVMQVPTAFVPWDDKSGVIGIRRHDKQLAICRCGIVLAGIYFQCDNANQGQAAVALKAMDKNQIVVQRDDVESEIRVMAQLQIGGVDAPLSNPYVIRWEHGEDQFNHYLATEYVSNGSLVKYAGKRIRQLFIKHLQAFADTYGEGPTKLECISYVYRDSGHEWMREGLAIFQGIMRGLTYLHAQSVAHLDLDIYNVAIDIHGVPRIIDFGSSQLMDNRGVVGAGSVGIKCKPTFVAPELQSHSKIPPPRPGFDGAKADMWSAGVILVQCVVWGFRGGSKFLTGNTHWRTDVFDHIDANCQPSKCHLCLNFISIPPLIGVIIKQLLHFDPNCRPSAYEVAIALQEKREPSLFPPPQERYHRSIPLSSSGHQQQQFG